MFMWKLINLRLNWNYIIILSLEISYNMKIDKYCSLGCGISLVFIIGMIYMTFAIDKRHVSGRFKDTLDTQQLKLYKKLTNERVQIYYTGYIVGFLISLCLIVLNLVILNKKMNKASMICLTGGVTFLTTYFYYILSSKSDYMIMHLKNSEQKKEWLNVYKTMQYNYHMGLVLGIIAVMALSAGFC